MSHDPLKQQDAAAPRECALWGRRSEITPVSEGFMKLPLSEKRRGARLFQLIEGDSHHTRHSAVRL
jgi:hypothetical protein